MNVWGIFFLVVFCPGVPLLLGISIEIIKRNNKRRNSVLIMEVASYEKKNLCSLWQQYEFRTNEKAMPAGRADRHRYSGKLSA
jgi:hypothetical protein